MKLETAMNIINHKESNSGFMVGFERVERGRLSADYFPDKHAGEKLIDTEEQAWDLAKRFAAATKDNIVNIYVKDHEFKPVNGYIEKAFKRRVAE